MGLSEYMNWKAHFQFFRFSVSWVFSWFLNYINMGSAASVHDNTNRRSSSSVVSDAYESVCKAIAEKDANAFRNTVRECPDEVILMLMGELNDLKSKAEKNGRNHSMYLMRQ